MARMKLVTIEAGRSPEAADSAAGPGAGAGPALAAIATPMLDKATAATTAKISLRPCLHDFYGKLLEGTIEEEPDPALRNVSL
ncbi:hypothetical protein R1sor_025133 [Riccia sorocarpa]|uniref:Uncharacterized protein n=1 Tax=Riccia sorocarpa TaxID=122646 RepID=A0ABD3GAU4_9MARC